MMASAVEKIASGVDTAAAASPVDHAARSSSSARDAKQQGGAIASAIERTSVGDTSPSGPHQAVGESSGERRLQVGSVHNSRSQIIRAWDWEHCHCVHTASSKCGGCPCMVH